MQCAEIFDKKVFEIAKSLPDRFPEPFLALEEYDRTRKLKRWATKVRANFTLDRNIMRKFRSHCEEKGFKMSSLLERLIKKEMQSS